MHRQSAARQPSSAQLILVSIMAVFIVTIIVGVFALLFIPSHHHADDVWMHARTAARDMAPAKMTESQRYTTRTESIDAGATKVWRAISPIFGTLNISDALLAASLVGNSEKECDVVNALATPLAQQMARFGSTMDQVIDAGTARDNDGEACINKCVCSRGGLSGYGRYCGFKFSGCPNQPPCDDIDRCCMVHDICVGAKGYVDPDCTTNLAKCAACVHYRSQVTPQKVYREPGWTCATTQAEVAGIILADIMFLLPSCFDQAEQSALAAAVDIGCNSNNTIKSV